MRPSGIEPAIFRLVAQCSSQMGHFFPRIRMLLFLAIKLITDENTQCVLHTACW